MTVEDAVWVGQFAGACAKAIHAARQGDLLAAEAELENVLSSFAASELCDEGMLEDMAPLWQPPAPEKEMTT